jgi:hypothetical protein
MAIILQCVWWVLISLRKSPDALRLHQGNASTSSRQVPVWFDHFILTNLSVIRLWVSDVEQDYPYRARAQSVFVSRLDSSLPRHSVRKLQSKNGLNGRRRKDPSAENPPLQSWRMRTCEVGLSCITACFFAWVSSCCERFRCYKTRLQVFELLSEVWHSFWLPTIFYLAYLWLRASTPPYRQRQGITVRLASGCTNKRSRVWANSRDQLTKIITLRIMQFVWDADTAILPQPWTISDLQRMNCWTVPMKPASPRITDPQWYPGRCTIIPSDS